MHFGFALDLWNIDLSDIDLLDTDLDLLVGHGLIQISLVNIFVLMTCLQDVLKTKKCLLGKLLTLTALTKMIIPNKICWSASCIKVAQIYKKLVFCWKKWIIPLKNENNMSSLFITLDSIIIRSFGESRTVNILFIVHFYSVS